MLKFGKKRTQPGSRPGTLTYQGEEDENRKVIINKRIYTKNDQEEFLDISVDECDPGGTNTVTWINIDGVHNSEIISAMGQKFDIHRLVLEDLLSTNERPKLEEYDHYLFLNMNMLKKDPQNISSEQVGLIISADYVLSFQEHNDDVFDPIRKRIKDKATTLRRSGADYLAYALIDNVVDHYFLVIEEIGTQIEDLEEQMLEDDDQLFPADTIRLINNYKKQLTYLKKLILPFRELVSEMIRVESKIIHKKTKVYLRDVYDHVMQIIDYIDSYKDRLSDLTNLHHSNQSTRLNEEMRFLTIIGTIFIPLTFLTGLYGMNFKHMPELDSPYAYPTLWVVMLGITLVLMIYFRKKGWF